MPRTTLDPLAAPNSAEAVAARTASDDDERSALLVDILLAVLASVFCEPD